jgi:hypothetical protein
MQNFKQLLNRLSSTGIKANTNKSREWFRKKVRQSGINRKSLMMDKDRFSSRITVGKMYCYYYNPKHSKTLPYYDEFPLIFVVDINKGGFLGINLHYVSPRDRLLIMESLSTIVNDKRYGKNAKLALSYSVLQKISKYNIIKPCLKRYLVSHVRSNFMQIDANEWDIAIFLPVQKFKKSSPSKIWNRN